jgi:hypothetical protein
MASALVQKEKRMKTLVVRFFALGGLLCIGSAASAAETTTVDTLLAEGYTVVAAVTSQIGPGVFLQKGQSLQLCFVSETPNSPAVTTRYCKPVH